MTVLHGTVFAWKTVPPAQNGAALCALHDGRGI